MLAGTRLSKLKACQIDLEVGSLIKIVTAIEWSGGKGASRVMFPHM